MTRLLLCTLLVAIAVVGAVRAHQLSMQTPGIDFYQFWALGQAVDEGLVGDIYEPAARHRLAKHFVRRAAQSGSPRQQAAAAFRSDALEAASTPFLYTVFFAIQTGEYDRDISRYRAASVALSVISIAVLCWLLRADPVRASVALVFATWAWVPLGDDLVDGNVNQVQLALLSLFLVLQQRAPNLAASVAAGAVLGLANFFKPNLAFVPLALTLGWVVDRSWGRLLRCWAGVSLGAGVAVALSSLFFGTPRCWIDWLELFRSFDRHFDLSMHGGNFGGARLLHDLLGFDLGWLLTLVGFCLLLVALLRSRARRDPADGPVPAFRREYLLLAAGAILPLLTTGLAWPHYLMLAVPMAVFVFVAPSDWARARSSLLLRALALVALAGGLAAFPVTWLELEDPYPLLAGALALSSLLFFGLALSEIGRARGSA